LGDVSSPCIQEAESLIIEISKSVDEKEKKDLSLMLKIEKDKQSMIKYRLNT
jgi:hypothetical protein